MLGLRMQVSFIQQKLIMVTKNKLNSPFSIGNFTFETGRVSKRYLPVNHLLNKPKVSKYQPVGSRENVFGANECSLVRP